MTDEEPFVPNPDQLEFPPALHLSDFGVEIRTKYVMLHEEFIKKYVRLSVSCEKPLELKCPYCDSETLFVTKVQPEYSSGYFSGPFSRQHHVGDSVEIICNNCGARFFGSITWIQIF